MNMLKHFQFQKTSKLDRETGLANMKYTIESRHQMNIDGATVLFLNVHLHCDLVKTPWCLKPEDHKQLTAI